MVGMVSQLPPLLLRCLSSKDRPYQQWEADRCDPGAVHRKCNPSLHVGETWSE